MCLKHLKRMYIFECSSVVMIKSVLIIVSFLSLFGHFFLNWRIIFNIVLVSAPHQHEHPSISHPILPSCQIHQIWFPIRQFPADYLFHKITVMYMFPVLPSQILPPSFPTVSESLFLYVCISPLLLPQNLFTKISF